MQGQHTHYGFEHLKTRLVLLAMKSPITFTVIPAIF